MYGRIYFIQAMRQCAYCGQIIVECRFMRAYIYAVCQATYYGNIVLRKVSD